MDHDLALIVGLRREDHLATYSYRCRAHGAFDVQRPIGTAAGASGCPTCGGYAARVYSPPMLAHVSRALTEALDSDERSREAPAVLSAPPPRARSSGRPRQVNPAVRNLPRP